MTSLLRGAEIDACVHRIALTRAEPSRAQRTEVTPEIERRRREADTHRDAVLERLMALHPRAVVATGHAHTEELINQGVELILNARLTDVNARRTVAVQGFIRIGRSEERFMYAPLVVKNHEVTEAASTRRLFEASLERLLPSDAVERENLGLRPTPPVRRDVLILDGATRVLEAFGASDPSARGALIDRNARLWWLDLKSPTYSRSNLVAYDAFFDERFNVLRALDHWFDVGGDFPTSPYWHRECLTCEFSEHCEGELESVDDVSLTRFTSQAQQAILRENGVATRATLARLNPLRVQRARAARLPLDDAFVQEVRLSRKIERLDELIYRARSHVRHTALRILEPSLMGCPTADVEVDIDMESYDDVTYLWGASVSVHQDVPGIAAGHVAFAEWGDLTAESEAANFSAFWSWLSGVRRLCEEQGRSFAAYCFWAQAEDGAMNRAVLAPLEGGPTTAELDAFRQTSPRQWIDLHVLAKAQIQTEGPLGLKQLATAAGFTWRDANPSGEASMLWYEKALGEGVEAQTSRTRILHYNEDDCRATRALRNWLNGAAKLLSHRDDPLEDI
ncbi:MAG TPA: TM0106 family RecB-like putative nuclease [Acidimicrobiales bacterium]